MGTRERRAGPVRARAALPPDLDQLAVGANRTRGSRSSRVVGTWSGGEVERPVAEAANGVGDVGRDGGQVVGVDGVALGGQVALAASVMSQAVE